MFVRRATSVGIFGTLAVGGLLLLVPAALPASAASPARTSTGPVWSQVSAGGEHSCGVRLDHSLWCWGDNTHGQLGLGDITNRSIPTQVGSDVS